MTVRNLVWVFATLACLEVASAANTNTWLTIGDPAPKLEVSEWLQGEPVHEFESNKVYVVAFWTTRSEDSRLSIRHVEWLHNKFKDQGVIVIGQNVYQRDTDEVRPFLQDMHGRMTYRVALDTPAPGRSPYWAKMYTAWVRAALESNPPIAFVVNKHGRIAWIGDSDDLKEQVLRQILDDTFDIQRAALERDKKRDPRAKFGWALAEKQWAMAEAVLLDLKQAR